jgi:hypothetical protein
LSETVLNAVKRELKRVSPDVKIEVEQIREVIAQEVIKREILGSEKYKQAEKAIERAINKAARTKKDSEPAATDTAPATTLPVASVTPPVAPAAPVS